jgi:hypothetical protein
VVGLSGAPHRVLADLLRHAGVALTDSRSASADVGDDHNHRLRQWLVGDDVAPDAQFGFNCEVRQRRWTSGRRATDERSIGTSTWPNSDLTHCPGFSEARTSTRPATSS